MFTERLEVRLPVEADRATFVELFNDDDFMVFAGVLDGAGAVARFDHMLAMADEMPYAKQPVIERSTGVVLGYVGIDRFEFDGSTELEFGWRLVPAARGTGYATEAADAVMQLIEQTFTGTVYAMIDPTNQPSKRVAEKLGFEFWKMAEVGGFWDELHRRTF